MSLRMPPFYCQISLVRIFLFVLFIFGLVPSALAQDLDLTPGEPIKELLPAMVEIAGDVDLSDPQSLASANLALRNAPKSMAAPRSVMKANTWYAVSLTNAGAKSARWMLDTHWFTLVGQEAYLVKANTATLLINESSPVGNFSNRTVPQRRLVSPYFELQAGETAEIWVKFDSTIRRNEAFSLQTELSYPSSISWAQSIDGFYFGIGISLVIFFILISIVLKFKTAFLYSGFIFFLLMADYTVAGYMMAFFHAERAEAFSVIFGLFLALGGYFYLMFVSSFVDAGKKSSWYYLVVRGFIAFGVTVILCLSWLINIAALVPAQVLSIVLGGLTILFYSIAIWGNIIGVREKVPGIWLALSGFLVFLAGGLVGIFYRFGILPLSILEFESIIRLTRILDGIFFGVAVIKRLLAIRRDRDKAQSLAIQANLDRDRAKLIAAQHHQRLITTNHDLRQPLTSLKLALEEFDEEAPHLKPKLSAGLDYLNSILGSSLSDTRQVDEDHHHHSPPVSEPVPLEVVFTNLKRMFAAEAKAKSLKLTLEKTDIIVQADVVTLIRCLSNLVSNAIKYTPSGSVNVSVELNDRTVTLAVTDTGPGMDKLTLERVMKSYERANKDVEGEGLGLSIVKDLARKQGWSFEAHSEPGQGSSFRIGNISIVQAT